MHFCTGGNDSMVHIWDVAPTLDLEVAQKRESESYFNCMSLESPLPTSPRSALSCTVNKILRNLNMAEYSEIFAANSIDMSSLFLLTNEDLREVSFFFVSGV